MPSSLQREVEFYRKQARINNWDRYLDNNRIIQTTVAATTGLTVIATTAYECLQTGEFRSSFNTGMISGCVVGGIESAVWFGAAQYYNVKDYFAQRRSKRMKKLLEENRHGK
jgi:hypothetical protein